MSKLQVVRNPLRKALFLPMGKTSKNPSLIFPLTRKLDASELDEQIRIQLEKLGITKESDVQAIFDKAETDYEYRIKVSEARREIRRLMKIRESGGKLMQVGNRKWKQVFYPAIRRK